MARKAWKTRNRCPTEAPSLATLRRASARGSPYEMDRLRKAAGQGNQRAALLLEKMGFVRGSDPRMTPTEVSKLAKEKGLPIHPLDVKDMRKILKELGEGRI